MKTTDFCQIWSINWTKPKKFYDHVDKHVYSANEAFLKLLRSVQISILNRKITPEVLRIDQYCEKILGMLTSKPFFSVRFGVAA